MSSNNYSRILIYYLPPTPAFSPKLFTIFLPYGLKGNAHTFVSWRYCADIFCTNGPSKSFVPQESEPGSHNGPHPAFQAPPVILSHMVQLPPPQRLESFWTWGYFSSSFQTLPRSWQKKKKSPIFYTILITLHFSSQILFSCFLAVIHTGAWHRTYSVALHWYFPGIPLLAILWNSEIKWIYLSFSPLPLASLLSSAICKASADNHFAFLHFFFLGMALNTASCTLSWTSVHSSSGSLSSDLIPWICLSIPLYNR